MKFHPHDREEFLARVRNDGCWFWIGTKYPSGYGAFCCGPRGQKKTMRAHRVSWLLFRGEILNDLNVLHKCCRRDCVNPDHLYLGTDLDNAVDRKNDGNTIKGKDTAGAKLDERLVMVIRAQYKNGGTTYRALGREYGLTDSAIGSVVRGETWKHV